MKTKLIVKKQDGKKVKKRKPISTFGIGSEKGYVVENLATLLASGMSVIASLNAIKAELKSKNLKKIIDYIVEDIESGFPVWKALGNSSLFQDHIISLIRIGEETGKLPQNLKVIALQEEKDRSFKSKIASAAIYPVFVFSLTILIGVGIAWFILPNLSRVFGQLRIKLPLLTQLLIGLGTFLGKNGYYVVPIAAVVAFLVIYFTFFFSKTKKIGQALMFSFPPIKKLIQEVEIARMGYILGNLLQSALPILDALDSLGKSSDYFQYRLLYKHMYDRIDEGDSFQKSFTSFKKSNKLIPIPVQQLIVSGEESGHLPEALLKIGEMYEARTEDSTKNLSVILEPILLVIVWLGVVSVAMAVILPLYSLIGGLNNDTNSVSVSQKSSVAKVTPSVTQSVSPTKAASQKITVIDTGIGYLNVRADATKSAVIVGKIPVGDTVLYSEKKDNWYKVTLPAHIVGWVTGDFVKEAQ